jgi:CHAT domain-containing protein/Flp pilus assembly protein TadD
LDINESELGLHHPDVASSLNNLAALYRDLGRYQEAEPLYLRALEIRETALGPNHRAVATSLSSLGIFYSTLGRYSEAEALQLRALEIRESELGSDHTDVALSLTNLASLFRTLGRYAEAEPLLLRALEINERELGPNHLDVAGILNNLAGLCGDLGRHEESESLHLRSLKIRQNVLGPKHLDVALSLNNLAVLFDNLGRYAEAEPFYLRALEIQEVELGPDHPDIATTLSNVAGLYHDLGRRTEAEPLELRALEIRESVFGPNHPDVAASLTGLGALYYDLGRYAEAESSHLRSLEIKERVFGPDHPDVGTSLNNLAFLYDELGRFAEAEPLYLRALKINEEVFGPNHPDVALSLNNLAHLYYDWERYNAAMGPAQRALEILDGTDSTPSVQINAHHLHAQLQWMTGDRSRAMGDLSRAMNLVERRRPLVGGDEQLAAEFFSQYSTLYDRMVHWQMEQARPEAAFQFCERGRAQMLLTQLAAGQVDLRQGIAPDDLEPLEAREREALGKMAGYQQRITLTRAAVHLSDNERFSRIATLGDSLAAVQADYDRVHREIKNASPLWRDMLSSGGQPISLEEAQITLVADGEYILLFHLGKEASYLFLVPPPGAELEVTPLAVPDSLAPLLGTDSGPLTRQTMQTLLHPAASEGGSVTVLPTNPTTRNEFGVPAALTAQDRLHALHQVLFPGTLWRRMTSAREVIIIPDGALYQLPFETLVTGFTEGEKPEPTYWLDEGPIVRYAASATTLHNVEKRRFPQTDSVAGVLSLSDAIYDPSEVERYARTEPGRKERETLGIPSSGQVTRNRFERLGGSLSRLPGTALETEAILEAFPGDLASGGVSVLQEESAGEPELRDALGGIRYLHLATHGLVDLKRSSMFASLALTPPAGESEDPEDDGFLQLHEIYELNLGGVELAVLSACQTNVGEDVEGEGVFALSRGFLVAGAERVIASQWSVADESTAVLIGTFFRMIAEGQGGGQIDYSAALRRAQIAVRNHPDHPEWSDPFFWAPFVLTGKR